MEENDLFSCPPDGSIPEIDFSCDGVVNTLKDTPACEKNGAWLSREEYERNFFDRNGFFPTQIDFKGDVVSRFLDVTTINPKRPTYEGLEEGYRIPDLSELVIGSKVEYLGQATTKMIRDYRWHEVVIHEHTYSETGESISFNRLKKLLREGLLRVKIWGS